MKKISDRVTSNKTKHLLVENELKKLETFDLSYFKGKIHFEEGGTQHYLVFQPIQRYFKSIAGAGSGNYIYFWKSKGLSDERIINIVYEISKNYNVSSFPALGNFLFGAVSLTKHVDIDKYKYSGYGIGFDKRGRVSFGNGFGRNVIIFGADMSSSVHANNKTKNILVFGKDFIQGIDDTTV